MSFIELQLTAEEREAIREEDGYIRGKAEESLRIAKNLKNAGIPVEIIAENTGLPVEKIEKL